MRKQKPSDRNPALKEKKEAILKGTRKKMGISEEKRADFQSRMKEKRERQKETAPKKGTPIDNSEARRIRSELAADRKAKGEQSGMRSADFRPSPIAGLDRRDYDAYQKMKQTNQGAKEVESSQKTPFTPTRGNIPPSQQARSAQVREANPRLTAMQRQR